VIRHSRWLALSLLAGAPGQVRAQAHPAAVEIVQRIRQNIGVPWAEQTVDTFKDGDSTVTVTGIAVTMMATLDVLQRAAAAGANLVITHEPTFYDHFDRIDVLERERDAVTAAKRAFIREHRMVILRMHDHWHRRHPDGIAIGMARALQWEPYRDSASEYRFTLPPTSLGALAATIRQRLHSATLRVVGDADQRVSRIALVPGAAGFELQRHAVQPDDIDVVVIGEAREWETVEYVADAITEGRRKALIVVGHIPSEQAGMEDFARWLAPLVRESKVTFIPTRDPFWSP